MKFLYPIVLLIILSFSLNAQNIAINQGATAIPSGGSFNFGTVEVGSSASTIFSLVNSSTTANLNVTTPISVTGQGYLCTAQPATLVTSTGGVTQFTIEFEPEAVGAHAGNVQISSNAVDFPSYSFSLQGSGGAPLPVEILNFFARLEDNGQINIEWTTAMEQNNDYFLLEKSADGTNYQKLAQIKGQSGGDSQVPLNYRYTDPSPFEGENFYRLIQVDKDGGTERIGVRVVRNAGLLDNSWQLYPNPVREASFSIKVPETEQRKRNVRIMDASGRVIFQRQVTVNSGQINIALDRKPVKGIYSLYIEGLGTRMFIYQ